MATMTLGGLWHGASWTFVAWGALHGALLVGHRAFRGWCEQRPRLERSLEAPLGTLARWPFEVDGDRATGPGAFDMKGGIVQGVHALSLLDDLDGIELLLTSDEEIGSLSSRGVIEDVARRVGAALILEPSAGGALKTARKGTSMYRIVISGSVWPSNFMTAGRVTLARTISLA